VVDLRVTVDGNMRFDKHINKMVMKTHKQTAFIYRCFKSNKPEKNVFVRAFMVYVRPILEYCSPICNSMYMCDTITSKIKSAQRFFTKRLQGFHVLSHTN